VSEHNNYQRIFNLVTELTGEKDWSTRAYIQMTGDPLIGLFLSQVVWYSDLSSLDDSWFYKTNNEWLAELGLSYAQVTRIAGKLVEDGLIDIKKRRVNNAPTMHYRPVMMEIEALVNSTFAKLENCEIQESRNSENSNGEIQESLNSEIQESRISITETTQKQPQKQQLSNDNGDTSPPPEPKEPKPAQSQKPKAPKSHLNPATIAELRLFELLGVEFEASNRRKPKKFPSLACKTKFDKAATKLNGSLDNAIKRAFERGILSITGVTDFIAKYNGGKNATHQHSTSERNKQTDERKRAHEAAVKVALAKRQHPPAV